MAPNPELGATALASYNARFEAQKAAHGKRSFINSFARGKNKTKAFECGECKAPIVWTGDAWKHGS